MTIISDYFGRIHPLLLHFPIALIWVAAMAEVVRLKDDSPFLARAVVRLMALAAVFAVATAGSGWLLAAHRPLRGDERPTLAWHRWLGLATAILACFAWAISASWAETPAADRRWLRRISVWSTAAFVTAAAHLGALIVWGHDWFS